MVNKGDIGYNEYSFSYDGVAGSSSKTVTDYPITRDSYFRAQCVNEGTNRNINIDFKEMRM